MKKVLLLILSALLLLSCCACNAQSSPNTQTDTPPADTLTALLEQAGTTLQTGTAGSSLKAAYMAAVTLDWCAACTMDEESVWETVRAYCSTLSDEDVVLFREQISQLESSCQTLIDADADAAQSMLRDCGYTGSGYPWSKESMDIVSVMVRGTS